TPSGDVSLRPRGSLATGRVCLFDLAMAAGKKRKFAALIADRPLRAKLGREGSQTLFREGCSGRPRLCRARKCRRQALMREKNERQLEVLGIGAKILQHDLARLTDRQALLRADEARLLQGGAAQFVVFDDRSHIDRALDLPVGLRARALAQPVGARLLLVA